MIRTIITAFILASLLACNNTRGNTEKEAAKKGNTAAAQAETPAQPSPSINGPVKFGKYGCTASKYINGFYEYHPKGSFTLEEDGSYTYFGFENPSKGSFSVDEKGVIHFKDGYFNGGEATPMEGEQNRYYVVFPNNPDNRWTAGLK